MNTASAIPATRPKAVPIARLCAKSPSGPPSVTCPDSTIAASVSASTVAVGSLNADSAITVCATLGLRRSRSKSGIRIAGSVAARTAPISSATSKATSKSGATTRATSTAESSTPGNTSSPRPTAVRESTRNEIRCRRGRGSARRRR